MRTTTKAAVLVVAGKGAIDDDDDAADPFAEGEGLMRQPGGGGSQWRGLAAIQS